MNNAAYMIIKMHRQDPTVDLEPARKLLEEGLAIPEASEDCRKVMAMNLDHVRRCLEPGALTPSLTPSLRPASRPRPRGNLGPCPGASPGVGLR